jgi:plasmid stabilization system protein ParE
MAYRVILSRRAQRDRDDAFEWYCNNYSQEFAIRWYNGLHAALQRLETAPMRGSEASESHLYPFEVREVLIGTKRKNHRALYTIHKRNVVVLHVRHTAMRDLTEDDLP